MKKYTIPYILFIVFLSSCLQSCGSSNSTSPSSSSIVGSWALTQVQCISAPSSVCWKNEVLTRGIINAANLSTSIAEFKSDGTVGLVISPKVDTMSACKMGWKRSIDAQGIYSAAAGQMIVTINSYTAVSGSYFKNLNARCTGAYTLSANELRLTLNLDLGEKWLVVLQR
jgi:hypothetical protein